MPPTSVCSGYLFIAFLVCMRAYDESLGPLTKELPVSSRMLYFEEIFGSLLFPRLNVFGL